MSTTQPAAAPDPGTVLQAPAPGSLLSLNSDDVPSIAQADGKLQELLEELKCEIQHADAADPCKPRSFRHPPSGNEDAAWGECSRHIESHDDDLRKAFREEIDTLLVFAGLFSAIVTAFSIEAYQWLLVPAADANYQLLAQAIFVLSQNATTIAFPAPGQSSTTLSGAVATRLNAYWFLSLTLSLSAALIGILCKQWVRQFSHQPRTTGPELVGVRQMKYEGFQAWKVGAIISFLPLLLQLALGVFFLGVLELLWRLDRSVATVVTAAASVTMVFYLATTLLPAVQHCLLFSIQSSLSGGMPQCPYKSPQSLIVLRLMTALCAFRMPADSGDEESLLQSPADSHPFDSWVLFDGRYDTLCNRSLPEGAPKSHWRGLGWLLETTSRPGLREHVWHCLWANALRHWSGGKSKGAQLHSSPGPWHVLKTDPRTAHLANAIPEPIPPSSTVAARNPDMGSVPESLFTTQRWWAATIMYPIGTSFNETTRLEIYIRGLSTWDAIDPVTAYYVLDIILPDETLKGRKLKGLPGSLVRCATSYFSRHRNPCVLGMAHFLRKVATCVSADSHKRADAHLACLCLLYVRWLRQWGYHDNFALCVDNATMADLVIRRVKARAKHLDGSDRLRSLRHIEDFAELVLLVTLPYWDHISQGHRSNINWARFPPMFKPTLPENESLFRELAFIAISTALRAARTVPRTISVPMTRQEIEYLFQLRRTFASGDLSHAAAVGISQTPEPVHSTPGQQHPFLGSIVGRGFAAPGSMPDDGRASATVRERTPHGVDTQGRAAEPRPAEMHGADVHVSTAGRATIPAVPARSDAGSRVVRDTGPISGPAVTDTVPPLPRPPRPIVLGRSRSIPSLLSVQSGDVRSESPDSHRSIASMETSRSMLIGPRAQFARAPAARRRDTGDGASHATSDVL